MTAEQFKLVTDALTSIQIYQFCHLVMMGGILIFCALTAGHTKR